MFRTFPLSICTHNNGICHTEISTFYLKNKFAELVHLVGFIIRIPHSCLRNVCEYQYAA